MEQLIFVLLNRFYLYLQRFASNPADEGKQQLLSFFFYILFLEMVLTDSDLFILTGGCREVKLIKQERNRKENSCIREDSSPATKTKPGEFL